MDQQTARKTGGTAPEMHRNVISETQIYSKESFTMDHVAKVFYQEDCDLSLLYGKTIAVIGYGSQGHAHALNAKESLGDKARVIIGLYKGSKSWAKAEAQGFEVFTAAEAAKQADIIMILINDEKQAAMYKKDIAPNLEPGNMLMFAHGFAIHFGQIGRAHV